MLVGDGRTYKQIKTFKSIKNINKYLNKYINKIWIPVVKTFFSEGKSP